MKYWLHVGHEVFGGDLYGSYDTPEEAAQAGANIMLEVFRQGDVFDRIFRIVEAKTKQEAAAYVNTLAEGGNDEEES